MTARLNTEFAGTMTLSQAYAIANSYGDSIVRLTAAQSEAMDAGKKDIFTSVALQRPYLAHSPSQIAAALMLAIARGVLHTHGDRSQLQRQPEYTVLENIVLDFPFAGELRPSVPRDFVDRCFAAYEDAFSSCTPDEIGLYTPAVQRATDDYWRVIYSNIPLARTPQCQDLGP